MKNPLDTTNEYLEFLAGRRKSPPTFSKEDEDIPEVVNLLRTLRKASPSPAFRSKLKERILPRTRRAAAPRPTPPPERRSEPPSPSRRWFAVGVPALAVAVVVAIAFLTPHSFWSTLLRRAPLSKYVAQEAQAAIITLEATGEDELGVPTDTRFMLRAKEGSLSKADVETKLVFTPAVKFSVSEKGKNVFEIVPKHELGAKTVYTASYEGLAKADDGTTEERTYSWAYQVRDAFQIIGTLPRNKVTGVDPASGIEVTFSASGVTAKDFEKHLEIAPKTAGRVEVHNRTLVFVPDKKLKEKTLYTVTVKKGLKPEQAGEGLTEDTIFQFEVSSPQREQPVESRRIVPRNVFESARPNEPIIFAGDSSYPFVYYDEKTLEQKTRTYEFTVYQYPDPAAFVSALEQHQGRMVPWAMFANEGVLYSMDGLPSVGKFKTKSEGGVVMLGDGFPEGFYLADSTSNNAHSQIPFAVSNVGSYVLTTKTDTLVWVNDLERGEPVAGAEVRPRGTSTTAKTGADGSVTFATPDAIRGGSGGTVFATVRAGGKETVIVLNGNQPSGYYGLRGAYADVPGLRAPSDNYWSYLSTDREMYLPNDSVHVWGIAKRRDQPGAGEKVKLELVQRNYEGRYSTEIVKTVELTTSQTGTFMGTIELKDVSVSGYPELILSAGGEWLTSKSFAVETYRKPPYQITITPNRFAAIVGDTVTYTVKTTFFDGSPVPNTALRLETGAAAQKPDLVTDQNGTATYVQKVRLESSYVSFVPFEQYEGDIRGSSFITVYPAEFQIDATGKFEGSKGTVSGVVRNLHPELSDPSSEDPLAKVVGEPRAGQKLSGQLIAIITEKISEGTRYDFLLKKSVEQFRYETRDEERETFTVTTDAKGTFTKTIALDPKLFYRVELSGTDDRGNTANQTVYLWSRTSLSGLPQSTTADLSLVDLNQTVGQPGPDYAVGDTVRLQVNKGAEAVGSELAEKILFVTSQRGLKTHTLTDSPTYSFTFGDDDVPMLFTRAIVFTGTAFQELLGPTIDFRESTRALKITVTPDHESYGPGDTATLKVHVADIAGRGQQARVNLSAVDEAVVSLQGPRFQNILTSLYRWVDEGVIGSYTSHEAVKAAPAGAEMGGGGGDRIDFRDNALYTEIETDANGNGSTTVKLPDNLTSWRVTAQAVTDDLKAGQVDHLIAVQKPLFVVPNFSSRMLTRDRQKMSASAFGSALKANDPVTFTFSLPDVPGTEVVKQGKAFASVDFDLPSLEAGDHRLRIGVSAKGQSDAVIETVHVIASNLQQRVVKTAMLEKGEAPAFAPTGRTSLRLGDADRNLAYERLWGLLWNPYSRLDDTVAGRIASGILEDEFGEKPWTSPGDPTSFFTDKGLALYAIGSEDLEYGSLAAADPAFQENRARLVSWFRRTIDDPKSNTEQVAYALYGLAQLKEPVLPEIRALVEMENLSDREKLTLALALEALGAREEARPIARYLLDVYGEVQDPYLRLKLGATDDEKVVSTARFAILAAGLSLDDRYQLLQYLGAYEPKDTTTHLEQALALKALLEHAPQGNVKVTYTLNGKTETKELAKKDALTLSLSQDEAKSFAIVSHEGNVSVVSTYSEPFDPSKAPANETLSIKRVFSVNGKQTTTFRRGDVVKVELSWSKRSSALGTQFGLVDLLPTGLRIISNPWLFDRSSNLFYPYSVENNRVKFYAWEKPFFYYARAVVAGTAIAEPPVVQAFDVPGNIRYGAETTVTIE